MPTSPRSATVVCLDKPSSPRPHAARLTLTSVLRFPRSYEAVVACDVDERGNFADIAGASDAVHGAVGPSRAHPATAPSTSPDTDTRIDTRSDHRTGSKDSQSRSYIEDDRHRVSSPSLRVFVTDMDTWVHSKRRSADSPPSPDLPWTKPSPGRPRRQVRFRRRLVESAPFPLRRPLLHEGREPFDGILRRQTGAEAFTQQGKSLIQGEVRLVRVGL